MVVSIGEEASVYQQIVYDIHRQWLEEFDRQAAMRRRLPRRDRGGDRRRWLRLVGFRRTRTAVARPSGSFRGYAQA
jgi:hypothetical protein